MVLYTATWTTATGFGIVCILECRDYDGHLSLLQRSMRWLRPFVCIWSFLQHFATILIGVGPTFEVQASVFGGVVDEIEVSSSWFAFLILRPWS